MIRFTLILIGIFAISNAVGAIDDEHITIEQIYDMAQNVLNATEKWQQDLEHYSVEGRKSKFFPFGLLPFHALCELYSAITDNQTAIGKLALLITIQSTLFIYFNKTIKNISICIWTFIPSTGYSI